MARARSENAISPEQPGNRYPTEIAFTFWSGDTVMTIEVPWAVVPNHWPLNSPGVSADRDGAVGVLPQATVVKKPTPSIRHLAACVSDVASSFLFAIPVAVDSRVRRNLHGHRAIRL